MRRHKTPAALLCAVVLALASRAAVGSEERPAGVSLELLSHYEIPAGSRFEDTCIGGLSAIEHDAAGGRYFAVSDDRRGARFYTFEIDLSAAAEIRGVRLTSVVPLLTREGVPYPDDRVDPEGFVLLEAGTAFVSSEGIAPQGVAPFVDLVEVGSGAWLGTAPIPLAFRPRHRDGEQVSGVRKNAGFEALTLTPGKRHLITAAESALAQDVRGELRAGQRHDARMLRFEVGATLRPAGERLYPLTWPAGDILVHGLVELQALDDAGHLLALERTYGRDVGMVVRLFETHFDDHDGDVEGTAVLRKRRIVDFADLPIPSDNYEGLTLGPPLADGGETLLVLGDNDNVDCSPQLRSTKLLLFRLRR